MKNNKPKNKTVALVVSDEEYNILMERKHSDITTSSYLHDLLFRPDFQTEILSNFKGVVLQVNKLQKTIEEKLDEHSHTIFNLSLTVQNLQAQQDNTHNLLEEYKADNKDLISTIESFEPTEAFSDELSNIGKSINALSTNQVAMSKQINSLTGFTQELLDTLTTVINPPIDGEDLSPPTDQHAHTPTATKHGVK